VAYTFLCPSCQAQHAVPEHLIGRRVRCPQCGQASVVPEPKERKGAVREAGIPAEIRKAREDEEPLVATKKWKPTEAEMDMTPMCDVTFQLLIFFMVTAAFAMQKSIELPKPKQDAPSTQVVAKDPEEDPSYVTVYVDEFNTYRVVTPDWDVEAPSEQELLRKLREARNAGSGGMVPTKLLVKAHGDSLHEKVVAALDAGTEVGMEQVQLMTIEESE
jgi:biopolymer transport protein ExbD